MHPTAGSRRAAHKYQPRKDDADVFVNLYSPVAEGQRAFVRGLLGEQKFVGKSPVELDQ